MTIRECIRACGRALRRTVAHRTVVHRSGLRRLALAAALIVPVAAQAYDERFTYCFLCHGANGQGNASIDAPRIAGLSASYLERQLGAFKAGRRGRHPADLTGQEMWPMAAALSDADITAAAAYFAAMPGEPAAPTLTEGDPSRGASLYATCAGCHGDQGQGLAALGAPELAGQMDWYLVTQLNGYRNGWRGQSGDPMDLQMGAAMAVLPDAAAILDVVRYIGTLGAPDASTASQGATAE